MTAALGSSHSCIYIEWESHGKGNTQNIMYGFEQILEARIRKTEAIQPLTSYLTNYPCKMRRHEGEVRTNSLVMFFYWILHMDEWRLTNLYQFFADTRCSLEDLLGGVANQDRWQVRVRHSLLSARLDDDI